MLKNNKNSWMHETQQLFFYYNTLVVNGSDLSKHYLNKMQIFRSYDLIAVITISLNVL